MPPESKPQGSEQPERPPVYYTCPSCGGKFVQPHGGYKGSCFKCNLDNFLAPYIKAVEADRLKISQLTNKLQAEELSTRQAVNAHFSTIETLEELQSTMGARETLHRDPFETVVPNPSADEEVERIKTAVHRIGEYEEDCDDVALLGYCHTLLNKLEDLDSAVEYHFAQARDAKTELTQLRQQHNADREAAVQAYKDRLPADWFEDSSLETWFPMAAQELQQLRASLAEKDKEIDSYQKILIQAKDELSSLKAELATAQATIQRWHSAGADDMAERILDDEKEIESLKAELQTAMEERDAASSNSAEYYEDARQFSIQAKEAHTQLEEAKRLMADAKEALMLFKAKNPMLKIGLEENAWNIAVSLNKFLNPRLSTSRETENKT